MSTNGMQGSGYKEKHQNSNSKAKGSGSTSSNATTVNNNFTSYNNSNNAPSVQTPRKPVGYTFNNGQEKQPILRAQEYEPEDSPLDESAAVVPAVGLNFNYWMEHSYVVDQQISNIITEFIRPDKVPKRSSRSNAVARGTLAEVENIVILSVQDVDPRELNDNIYKLPFLSNMSTMPIRHVTETNPTAASFDESVFANASGEQLWQYLDVAHQNAMMLWTERPTVSLSSLVGVSNIELLTKYTLTFMGIHTQWQDEVVFYSDAHPVTLANNPATVGAFQDMARQKLVGCKDAPAYMLQMFCELTRPPMPGDIFGRCSKTHTKETGLFLYRPGSPTATTPTKARFLVLWFRAKEIDVLEEASSPEETHNKLTVYVPSDHIEHTRTFAKVVPPVVVGKGRFNDTMDFVMTLRKAVFRGHPAGFGISTTSTSTITDGSTDSGDNGMAVVEGSTVGNATSAEAANSTSVPTIASTAVSADSTTTTTATTSTTGSPANTHEYFDHALQTQLRTQFSSSAFKESLNALVLSQPMQLLMGFVVSRMGGYEDFIDTSEGFYGTVEDAKRGFIDHPKAVERVVMKTTVVVKVKEELEEGECEESDVSVMDVVTTTKATSQSSDKISPGEVRVNKKIYFTDENVTSAPGKVSTITTPTITSNNNDNSNSSGDSSDAEDNMAVLLANNARKRKAHLLAQQEEEDGELEEGEETDAPEVKSNHVTHSSKKSKLSVAPPPAPTNISDLINMYTPNALKVPSVSATSTSNNVGNGATPGKPNTQNHSGVKPPLPPLPPSTNATPTAASTVSNTASSTNINTPTSSTTITIDATTTATTIVEPYQCTLIPLDTIKTPLEMVALDCEMCSTPLGLELTRLTVLCPLNGVVYDTLVRPELDITDYHTEFSGITQNQLANVTTTLKDVQDTLRQLISDRTIIVGHSADTDLKVLQLVHGRVIDTSALFPHPTGLPYKHSLKKLAKDYLHKDIQDGKEGHDSVQDAAIALELAFLKARQGESGTFIYPWLDDPVPKCSLFEPLLSYESPNGPSMPGPVSVSVHGVPSVLGYGTPIWEDFAFGYRPEGDACLNLEHCRAALQAQLSSCKTYITSFNNGDEEEADLNAARRQCVRLEAQIEQLRCQRHGTTEEAFAHALQDLNTIAYDHSSHRSNHNLNSSSSSDSDGESSPDTIPVGAMKQKSLTIVEMRCGDEMEHDAGFDSDAPSAPSSPGDAYNTFDQDYSQGEESGAEENGNENMDVQDKQYSHKSSPAPRRPLTGLARIDRYAQQLLEAAPSNTLLLVVTQGNFKAMKQLASRKLRNRWEQAALKRKQSLVGLGRVNWDMTLDENRLIAAAAHATAGAVFLVKK